MIDYVTRKYGRENVAQIITFGTMKAKAVVRDVGRVLEMSFADVDKVAKQIPAALDMTLDKALEESEPLRLMEQNDPKVKELLSVARRLEGMTRHASVHAAGVVIAPKAITEYAPLYKGAHDEIVTQWSMKEIERVGLLKMDFLGLSTLTLIADAIEEIHRTTGETLDIDHLPLDDPKTYQIFQEGQTYGIFQFESSGMRDILRKSKPQRLEDLIALNALYRPGPLRSGMVDDFIARKQGRTEIAYELPQLEPVLAETYGVIAYQEQVMRISNVVAGFTLGEADLLRKAMGKKNAEVMAKMRGKFVQGAVKNGHTEKKAGHLFDLMEHFAGYGFNKSHSTAYAFLAYQTAYLKANYPWHFAAALLTIESQNTDKLALYLGECRDRGVPVLPPDINESQLRFTVEPEKGVRFGLTAIKNVGEGAIDSLLAVRKAGGRITSLHALCEDVDLRLVNKRVFESLVKAGAFDSLAQQNRPSRRCRRWRFSRGFWRPWTRPASTAPACSARKTAARAIFSAGSRMSSPADRPRWSRHARRRRVDRARAAGFRERDARPLLERPSRGPLRGRPQGIRRAHDRRARRPADARAAARRLGPPVAKPLEPDTSIGGIVAACRQLKTKKGGRMAVFTLEDAQGGVEVIVFPETYQRSAALIESGTLVLVRGKLERDEETARILATEIVALEAVRERIAREVAIRVQMPAVSRSIRAAGRSLFAPSRRSTGVLRDGVAVRSAEAARQRLVADSRQAVAGARGGSRADCRHRGRVAAMRRFITKPRRSTKVPVQSCTKASS